MILKTLGTAMLAAGLLDEVLALRARGDLHLGLPSMRCVGYRQMWSHLDGDTDLDTAREQAIAATRQLAKRQITWFKKYGNTHWFQPEQTAKIIEFIEGQIQTN